MWLYDYTEEEQKTKKFSDLYEEDSFFELEDGSLMGYNRWGEEAHYDKDGNFIGIVKTMEDEMIDHSLKTVYKFAVKYWTEKRDEGLLMTVNRYKRDYKDVWDEANSKLKKKYTKPSILNKKVKK